VSDYRAFALDVLKVVPDRPVSFEVFSDDFDEMELQALEIASWGRNVFVKIPMTNTRGESSRPLIKRLSASGVQINVTALMTAEQVAEVIDSLSSHTRNFISVFAGRIADTGRDPVPIMKRSVELLKDHPQMELIWASPRELLNVFQADAIGCHVITATNDILNKLDLVGKDLDAFSLETVHMFWQDAQKAGYTIEISQPATASEGAIARGRTIK
jgi:transaldolase